MNPAREYSSNLGKLVRHTDAMDALRHGAARPVTLHVALTPACNLECPKCCYRDRASGAELDVDLYADALDSLKRVGLKSVELTGGGEPMLHAHVGEIIATALRSGLAVGLCTNGTMMDRVSSDLLSCLAWIRFSGGTIEQGRQWDAVPRGPVLGCGYVWHDGSSLDTMRRLITACHGAGGIHLRIAPDAVGAADQVADRLRNAEGALAAAGGYEHAYVEGPRLGTCRACFLGYLKPFLWYDGNVYACPSACLSPERAWDIAPETRLCDVAGIGAFYSKPVAPHAFQPCRHCHFAQQNEYVEAVLTQGEHDDFA